MNVNTTTNKNLKSDGSTVNSIMAPQTKNCSICGELRPIDQFLPIPWSVDGRHNVCNNCYNVIYPSTDGKNSIIDFRWEIAVQDYTANTEEFWRRYFSEEMPSLIDKMKIAFSINTPIEINDSANVFQRLVNILADHKIETFAGFSGDRVEVTFLGDRSFNRFFEIIGMREALIRGNADFTDFIQVHAVTDVRILISPFEEGVLEEDDEGFLINNAPNYRGYVISFPKTEFRTFINYIIEYFRE